LKIDLFYPFFDCCIYICAAEQKARATYENLILLTDDPLVKDTLRWLREREVVHFQRFGEGLRLVEEYTTKKRFF
jgi:spore coat protein JC